MILATKLGFEGKGSMVFPSDDMLQNKTAYRLVTSQIQTAQVIHLFRTLKLAKLAETLRKRALLKRLFLTTCTSLINAIWCTKNQVWSAQLLGTGSGQ